MNTNIISKYLQLLRKKHNFTQDELAKRLDISRQAVSKWETGGFTYLRKRTINSRLQIYLS